MTAIAYAAVLSSLVFSMVATPESDFTTTRIGDNVLVVTGPSYEDHITAIATGDGLVIIDTMITLRATREARELIEQFSDEPVRYLLNTNFNVDYSGGNQVFSEAQIISHSNWLDHQENIFYANPSNAERLRAYISSLEEQLESAEPDSEEAINIRNNLPLYRAGLDTFAEMEYTPPSIYLDANATISLGGKSIEIIYLGPGHTDANLVVFVPQERILVGGGLIPGPDYIPLISNNTGGRLSNWISIIDRLEEMSEQVEYVVPGHGRVTDMSALEEGRAYLVALQEAVADAHSRGLTLEQAKSEIVLEEYQDRNFYDGGHETNIEAAWRELEGSDEN